MFEIILHVTIEPHVVLKSQSLKYILPLFLAMTVSEIFPLFQLQNLTDLQRSLQAVIDDGIRDKIAEVGLIVIDIIMSIVVLCGMCDNRHLSFFFQSEASINDLQEEVREETQSQANGRLFSSFSFQGWSESIGGVCRLDYGVSCIKQQALEIWRKSALQTCVYECSK